MAIYAQFDEAGACIQLASNTGWSDFGDWVETLDSNPRLSELWETGSCEDISGLRAEMEQELADKEPENPDVASVAHQLIHAIDAGSPAEIMLITAGVSTDPEYEKSDKEESEPAKAVA